MVATAVARRDCCSRVRWPSWPGIQPSIGVADWAPATRWRRLCDRLTGPAGGLRTGLPDDVQEPRPAGHPLLSIRHAALGRALFGR